MFSYIADQDDEINIKEGDSVDVITMETEDGWWLVCYGDQEGLAPSNYLSLIPPPPLSNIKGMMKKFSLSILDSFKHDLRGFSVAGLLTLTLTARVRVTVLCQSVLCKSRGNMADFIAPKNYRVCNN